MEKNQENIEKRWDYRVAANFASLLTAQGGRRERQAAPSPEYFAPVWCQSTHTKTQGVPLNKAMRIVLGCIHPFEFLTTTLGNTVTKLSPEKNSVNAYTTKQITLTIFYTRSYTAKPLQKGLNLANLFVHFWNHHEVMTPARTNTT